MTKEPEKVETEGEETEGEDYDEYEMVAQRETIMIKNYCMLMGITAITKMRNDLYESIHEEWLLFYSHLQELYAEETCDDNLEEKIESLSKQCATELCNSSWRDYLLDKATERDLLRKRIVQWTQNLALKL